MLQAPFRWEEVIPRGGVESAQTVVNYTDFTKTLDIYVDFKDIAQAIKYIIGTAQVTGARNPDKPELSSWRLSRTLPARHPRYGWLRATKINSLTGIQGAVSKITSGFGTYGNWRQARIQVQFESPKYLMLDDATTGGYEYLRYVHRQYDVNIEQLSRKGENMQYVNGNARAITQNFVGERIIKQPKGVLRWTWHMVPEAWIMLGGVFPSNLYQATGTVNLRPFPQAPNFFIDQNDAITPVQFKSGTLLMMPPKITPETLIHPNLLTPLGNNSAYLPRCYRVEFEMIHFDPRTDDDTVVRDTQLEGNNRNILIRGHNLQPLPRPSNTGFSWYAGVRAANPVSPVQSDALLIYQYYDFERCFSWARSLT